MSSRGRGKPKKSRNRAPLAYSLEDIEARNGARHEENLSESGSDEGSESGSESEIKRSETEEFSRERRNRGVDGLIEIDNPNLVKPKHVSAKDIDVSKTADLTRREREELERQESERKLWKETKAGETEQARKDLERLTIIRKQREDAAKIRAAEEKAKETQRKNEKSEKAPERGWKPKGKKGRR